MKSCYLESEASILTRIYERYDKSHEMYLRAKFQTETIYVSASKPSYGIEPYPKHLLDKMKYLMYLARYMKYRVNGFLDL